VSAEKKSQSKTGINLPSSMPAHGKIGFDYVLKKRPDIFIDGDEVFFENTGYRRYLFPIQNRTYWAKTPVKWKNIP